MTISLFTKCLFEFIGTALLILLGDGVVASSLLKHSKGFGGGWVVITFAWGFAVMCGAFVAAPYSGAHLNPALSIGLALAHTFSLGLCTCLYYSAIGRWIFGSCSGLCFL